MPGVRTRPREPDPNRTLGWGCYAWMIEHLVHGITGMPLELNDETLHFLLCFYALDDDGGWVYDRAAMRRARGTGKSPTLGNIANNELCGPARFAGWDRRDEYGNLLGISTPAPWVQIVATTVEQTRPIFDIAATAWTEESIDKYGLTIGKESIIKSAWPSGRLDRIPNNPRSLRGPRPTAVFADEVSEWVHGNGGHEAMVRIRSNLAKDPSGAARLVEAGNAFVPGEDSHSERTHQAFWDQTERTGTSSILLDSLEAEPHLKLYVEAELREAITQAKGDSDLHVDRLVTTAMDPSISPSQFRREHLNQLLADEDSLISAQLFDELSAGVRPLGEEDAFTLGFDGSLTGDGTAIVAYRLSDRTFHLLAYWEPNPQEPEWRIDEEAVDQAMRAYLERSGLRGSACDVHPFESWVYAWERDYGQRMQARISSAGMLICDNRSNIRELTHANMALVNEIESKRVGFHPSSRMRQHWANAKRRLNPHGFSFGKETRMSRKRVDIVAACLNAYRVEQALALNPVKTPVAGEVVQLKP